MKYLLEHGANPNAADSMNNTPLDDAHKGTSIRKRWIFFHLYFSSSQLPFFPHISNHFLCHFFIFFFALLTSRVIVNLLTRYGALLTHDTFGIRNSYTFKNNVVQCFPLLCNRANWIYAELWIPSDDERSLLPSTEWYSGARSTDVLSFCDAFPASQLSSFST